MKIQLSDHFTYGKLIRFTLPTMAMMIISSVYGVIDGLFVSNLAGKTPFAAINLIMPYIMIFSTAGFMYGTGGSAIVATTLGEKKKDKANEYFSLFVYFSLALGVLLAVLGIAFARPVALWLGAEGELLENAVLYARIVLAVLPFNTLMFFFQPFFSTAEKPQLGLITTISSGVMNILLDALLVILLPQEYKLIGAAAATAMSQVTGGTIPLVYFGIKNPGLLRIGKAEFNGRIILKATVNGSSEFMSNISMSVVGMLYNVQLIKYAGENGVAAYGVMMYVSMIFSAMFVGYSMGTAPIIGYHHGAKNYTELKSLLKRSVYVIGVLAVGMLISAEVLAVPLAELFVGYDAELSDVTVSGFRIFAVSFLFMGYAIYGSCFFTALNDGLTSAVISFLRTMVFQTASVLLLPIIWDIDGIWYSIIIAEFMAMALSAFFVVIKRSKDHYM